MESKNRNVWITVAVALMILCCCAMAVLVVSTGLLFRIPETLGVPSFIRLEPTGYPGERLERTFAVGSAPYLSIDNFSGPVSVLAGDGEEIRVVATKRVRRSSDLVSIRIDMREGDGRLAIKTEKPGSLSSVSVELEVTTPAGTRLELLTGSGQVTVQGLQGGTDAHTGSGTIDATDLGGSVKLDTGSGSVSGRGLGGDVEVDTGSGAIRLERVGGDADAHTGSGGIDVAEAVGNVRLDTGSGQISYQGTPQGDCRFETGSGGIILALPGDLNMELDLETGSGHVSVDYEVAGQVSRQQVKGVVGDGSRGSIRAHTGSGHIELVRR
jgi:DUF4097 and DUF4098 domain-containing protein YvlB